MIVSTREIPGSLFRASAVEVTAAVVPDEGPADDLAPASAPAFVPSGALVDRAAALYGETSARSDADVGRELDALRACVAETQNALSSVARQARMGQDLQLPPAAAQFNTHLSMLGFDPILAEELVRQLMQGGVPRTAAGFRVPARAALGRVVKSCPPPWEVPELGGKKRRVIALVGPTGVGKTTTLAKIAARALLDHRRKVALLTFDTYRIGAAEQIAHYGNLMDLPTFVARDRSELCTALSRCQDAELVLIDTAGRSNMEDVARQAELARSDPGSREPAPRAQRSHQRRRPDRHLNAAGRPLPPRPADLHQGRRDLGPRRAALGGGRHPASRWLHRQRPAGAGRHPRPVRRRPHQSHPGRIAMGARALRMTAAAIDQATGLRQQLRVARPPLRVVAVTSGKGGVGKTNLSTNLAVLAAREGRQVLLIDADLALSNVEILYGLRPRYHLGDLLSSECQLEDVLAIGPHGVKVLPATSGNQALTQLTDAQKAALCSALDLSSRPPTSSSWIPPPAWATTSSSSPGRRRRSCWWSPPSRPRSPMPTPPSRCWPSRPGAGSSR